MKRRSPEDLKEPEYYTPTTHDCPYSEGRLCVKCPWEICVENLAPSARIRFGLAYQKDKAKSWRKRESSSAKGASYVLVET